MGTHHLISIEEDQLRNHGLEKDAFLRTLGSAVVIACTEPGTDEVSLMHEGEDGKEPKGEPIITIRHLAEHPKGDVELWVWASPEGVAIADLSRDQLKLLAKIVASRQRAMSQSGS